MSLFLVIRKRTHFQLLACFTVGLVLAPTTHGLIVIWILPIFSQVIAPCLLAAMYPIVHLLHNLLLASSFTAQAQAQPSNPVSRITVVGVVFCDTCSSNTLSRHSYFLPGVEVNIECKFKARSPKTAEQMSVSVNRTTDKYGVYKVEMPDVDGVDCVEGLAVESLCEASLIGSKSKECNVPGLKTCTNQISVKSKQDNLCIYSLNALSYRPSKRNATFCRNLK